MSQTKAQLVQPVGIVTGTGINVTGVITATSFVGSGEGLTGVASTDNIITGTAATFNNTVQVNSTLTANSGFTTNAINTNLNVTGVTTIATVTATSLTAATGVTTNATHTNLKVTGVGTFAGAVTAASFSGDGSGLTGVANTGFINAEQLTVVGVVTAATGNVGNLNITKSAAGAGATVGSFTGVTTFYGDGSNLAGVGESIAPWTYNPDIGDTTVDVDTGIGITFNKKVLAGSGTATLKIVNAGTAGTTIQSWGISSATFPNSDVTTFSLGSLVSDLIINQTYQVDIPEGFVASSTGTDYVGTAWTFTVRPRAQLLWAWGYNNYGQLGLNESGAPDRKSSPVQVPGDDWGVWSDDGSNVGYNNWNIKMGGELWGWGANSEGQLADSTTIARSSPVKIGSDTSWKSVVDLNGSVVATKTDGTLWSWGRNTYGQLGQNAGTNAAKSSPTQVPGTTWNKIASGEHFVLATKTNGTLWAWGYNNYGQLGQNSEIHYSSPVQVPGTTWRNMSGSGGHPGTCHSVATKTDGTLWVWGYNSNGGLGQNNQTHYSSPVQIPGTSWSELAAAGAQVSWFGRTDGTLWAVGDNQGDRRGALAQNNNTKYSSPVQIPGTTWRSVLCSNAALSGTKTDGSLWVWGNNAAGILGQNVPDNNHLSSPVQISGSWKIGSGMTGFRDAGGVKTDGTAWVWGFGTDGIHGLNQPVIKRSSPTQLPGTNWSQLVINSYYAQGLKTDGTLWSWGYSYKGSLGLNQSGPVKYSSPVQIPGTDWTALPTKVGPYKSFALRRA